MGIQLLSGWGAEVALQFEFIVFSGTLEHLRAEI